MSGMMKSYIFTVIIINTRCGNNRPAKESADVFNGAIRSTEIWLCMNIKTLGVFRVHFIFYFTKSETNTENELFKQHFAEGIQKKVITKVFDRTLGVMLPAPPSDMRIPF